jgi:flagellar basal body-associated protein FliL
MHFRSGRAGLTQAVSGFRSERLISRTKRRVLEGFCSPVLSCPAAEFRLLSPIGMPEETLNLATPRRRWLVPAALAVPVLLLLAVALWFWVGRGAAPQPSVPDEPRVQSTLHLETFVLNLADADQRSYLRVGIDLGLSTAAKAGEGSAPIAEVRDVILSVLTQGKVDELLTVEGKTRLKENLLHALQERVPQLGVEEIYFTEFLIQR